MKFSYDIVIIGGGFFGLSLARHFKSLNNSVCVIEKEQEPMLRASYNNQARVHNGYHYPRSILTALRSKVLFPKFVQDHSDCIEQTFEKYYAIGKKLTNITSKQFTSFCNIINAPIEPAPKRVIRLFNPHIIENVYKTTEYAFNSKLLKEKLLKLASYEGIDFFFQAEAFKIHTFKSNKIVQVKSKNSFFEISVNRRVINSTYANTNQLLSNSNLPLIPLTHEIAEMCLVELPEELKNLGVTIMCGPFFSFMPFPSTSYHTFSHVRYTPHFSWKEDSKFTSPLNFLKNFKRISNWNKMQKDAQRYIPALKNAKHMKSLWEIKTILPKSESDDGRPILFKKNYKIKGFDCVMGGKIDNIYDIISTYQEEGI